MVEQLRHLYHHCVRCKCRSSEVRNDMSWVIFSTDV